MGQEFLSLLRLETKRLLWLIGITFALIIAFQCFELPYGNVLLNLFYTSKIPTSASSRFQSAEPPSKSELLDNLTSLNQPYFTVGQASGEKETFPRDGFVLKPVRESNKSLDKISVVDSIKKSDNGSATKNAVDITMSSNSSGVENTTSRSEHKSGSSFPNALSPPAIAPTDPTSLTVPPTIVNPNNTTPELSNISSIWKENVTSSMKDEKNKDSHIPIPEVTSISEMNKLLLRSRASYRSMRPLWSSAVDQELLHARSEIESAHIVKNDPSLYAPIYRNVSMFKRSYELMEETLKVYVYREGAKPVLHSPFLSGIYASEGWFMKLMEANKRLVTKDPKKAHLFYLPFSSRMLEQTLYVQNSHSHKNLIQYLNNYVDMIAGKHPFWNRTEGADHFLVACHDWAPAETKERLAKCIRALCNADVKEGFVFGKDVSLPETNVHNFQNPTKDVGGFPVSKRPTLVFFAGSMHGYVRPILLQHWQNKDPDMKIFGKLGKSKGNRDYIHYMKSSKYCICAKGYEVNSPRVVEAIFYECVPVIISDNFVPPFFQVLNWESFAVFVLEKDIPNLKSILLSISRKKYLQMLMRVKKVQQHFLWHANPVKYDIFHMILHSIWYNRVFSIRAR